MEGTASTVKIAVITNAMNVKKTTVGITRMIRLPTFVVRNLQYRPDKVISDIMVVTKHAKDSTA